MAALSLRNRMMRYQPRLTNQGNFSRTSLACGAISTEEYI